MFTRFLNARKNKTYPALYFDKDLNLNTFYHGYIEDGLVDVHYSSNLDSPYNVIQGVQILK